MALVREHLSLSEKDTVLARKIACKIRNLLIDQELEKIGVVLARDLNSNSYKEL